MDQIQEQVNPVAGGMPPISPEGVTAGDQSISEEQRQALMEMISKVRGELGSLDAVKFASQNKTEALRNNLLQQVFEKLQMAGVDLSSRESVAAFIMKLQENNPELAAMFEKAMDALLGTPEGGSMGTPQDQNAMIPPDQGAVMPPGVPPENNMNNVTPDETIPQSQ